MNLFRLFIVSILITWTLPARAESPSPESVVVVANANRDISVALAREYMQGRQIPEKNLILLETPEQETIDWSTYVRTIHNPLLEQLAQRGWIDAYTTPTTDDAGRLAYVTDSHRLGFLVVMHGIPLRISNDRTLLEATSPLPSQKQFQVNNASVDGELALLTRTNAPTVGFVPNPLIGQENPTPSALSQVIRVARLDGPDASAVRSLMQSALEGEKQGLRGRAYVDMGGPHERGNEWLKGCIQLIEMAAYDLSIDERKELFDWDHRFDAPAIYFGWWEHHIRGPVADPAFRFAPGAIGFHIHSFSAQTLRNRNRFWSGPLVSRGIAATVGNVYEPYLELSHHPHLFLQAILQGKTTGEAAYYALPALSWQAIFLGDPLYRPMLKDLNEQRTAVDSHPQDPLNTYVYLREINFLLRAGKADEALALGATRFRNQPSLPLAFRLAQLLTDRGNTDEAVRLLGFLQHLTLIDQADLGLACEMAAFMASHGAPDAALHLYNILLTSSDSPQPLRDLIRPTAITLAEKENRADLVQAWTAR